MEGGVVKRVIVFSLILVLLINAYGYCEGIVEYYGINSCSDCLIVENFLNDIAKKYGVDIVKKDLSNKEIEKEFIRLTEDMNIPTVVPLVVVKGIPLVGREAIETNLEDLIMGREVDVDKPLKSTLGLLYVMVAGLIDGVNPCALAMLIFFLTILLGLDEKKNIFYASMAYILGTFVVYTLLGFGLMRALLFIEGMKVLTLLVYLAVIILCMVAFLLNVHDYIELRKGNFNIKNMLSKRIKKKIHTIIENNVGEKVVYTLVFLTGAVVSVLEFACTGQVYIPTLTFISSQGGNGFYYTYILVYNICFIVPLIAVTVLVNKSKDTLEASDVLLNKLKHIKLITSILYVIFIIYMVNRLLLII